MSKVIKHTKRYEVQWYMGPEVNLWDTEKSFHSRARARRYARSRTRWMPYEYRVVDTEADE